MTSGSFHSVPIASIKINREGRQRNVVDDIETLADSISRLGLIHPLVITRGEVLVAGERRLAACNFLGHTHVACQYVDELDPPTLHAIELEENIKRKNLEWQDECEAVLQYQELRTSIDPKITKGEIARALGMSDAYFSQRVSIAGELRKGNEKVLTAPKFSTARGIIARAQERKEDEVIIETNRILGKEKTLDDAVLNVDFLQWVMTYDGPKFNFVHCDFPYGIGADKFNQGAAPTHGGYDDTEQTYWDLCHCLLHNLDRLCTDNCHFMFWFSLRYYQETLDLFTEHGINFDPFPLIWVKSDNVGILPDPQRGPRRIYETCFFGSRGDRKIVRTVSNAFAAPTDRSQHMSIKPVPVLENFFRMFVDPSTSMLDPTCGSGSSLRAARTHHASYILGLEINKEFAENANMALRK